MMTIGVLALQGAFIEHERVLKKLGVPTRQLRCLKDLEKGLSGLILPGGESTVQGKLLKELDMYDELKKQIEGGLPVLATCAGLILLAERIESGEDYGLKTIPMTVKRNAYGRQLGSFFTKDYVSGIGKVPMTFIRAPYISSISNDVNAVSVVGGNIVAVSYKNQFACSFHPELDEDLKIHKAFLAKAFSVL